MRVSLRVKRFLEAHLAAAQVGFFFFLRVIFDKSLEKLSH